MKECKQCHRMREETDFYVSTPRRCKECIRANIQANRELKAEYYREYERKRSQMPHRKAKNKAYRESPRGRKVVKEIHRIYRMPHRGKSEAERRSV